jgi:hypothetical protein
MTLLNGSAPTLRSEDNFRLVYLGTYSVTTYDKATNTIGVEEREGPLPKGKFVWNGEDYLGGLEAGQAKLVPFDLVRVFFGDPRSVPGVQGRTEDKRGVVGDIPPREHEIRRLATLYGLYDANAEMLPFAVPQVAIHTADDIEVICPATDPDGEHVYGYTHDTAEVHDVATQLANMRQQIAMLEQQAKAEEKKGSKNDGSDVSHDGPPDRR